MNSTSAVSNVSLHLTKLANGPFKLAMDRFPTGGSFNGLRGKERERLVFSICLLLLWLEIALREDSVALCVARVRLSRARAGKQRVEARSRHSRGILYFVCLWRANRWPRRSCCSSPKKHASRRQVLPLSAGAQSAHFVCGLRVFQIYLLLRLDIQTGICYKWLRLPLAPTASPTDVMAIAPSLEEILSEQLLSLHNGPLTWRLHRSSASRRSASHCFASEAITQTLSADVQFDVIIWK